MRVQQIDLHGRPADDERRDDGRDHFRHALLSARHLFAFGILSENVDDQAVENGDDDQRHDQAEQGETVRRHAPCGVEKGIVVTK